MTTGTARNTSNAQASEKLESSSAQQRGVSKQVPQQYALDGKGDPHNHE